MDSASLVSIVITSYNYARFLGEAIESGLKQTYRPLEVVVVDDGSTDDSVAVARRYDVRLIEQSNAGVSVARNRGAAEAQGELIVFLDADDLLEPAYVERCHQRLSTLPLHVAYVYTQMRLFGDEDSVFLSHPFSGRELIRGNFVPATALLRRRPFVAVGGFDPSWRLGFEDYELWLRMYDQGYRGVLLPEPLLRYRRHGPSRNVLSEREQAAINNRLVYTYPRLFWREWLRPWRVLWQRLRYRDLKVF